MAGLISVGAACSFPPRPDDAARRHAGHLVRAAILVCQHIAIGAGRAAHDAALLVAGVERGLFPWPVVGHRAFDGEHTSVVVGDDEVEWLAGVVSRQGRTLIKAVIQELLRA